ncbi:hypothetical protein V8J38_16805 (plasmid) [Brevundimonas olei]|uniref:Uncharacterized protein n=1 Tax=Brevundimonas olei TaxID=657642 RepID=A0ABZ2INK0_9CAUL
MAADSPDTKLARTRAFNTKHGQAWAVIEGAGMEGGDRHVGRLYKTFGEAFAARAKDYEPSELDRESSSCLHVAIARWDAAGDFWTYDY